MHLLLFLNLMLTQASFYGAPHSFSIEMNEEVKTLYKYSVSYTDDKQLDEAVSEIEMVINVTKVKVLSKPESKKAQILIYVEEMRIQENQEMFSIKPVKDIIIGKQMTPLSYSFEKLK